MCIFCKIIKGDIPSEILYQDNDMIVIRDIAPTAPVHVLIIPKEHIVDITQIDAELSAKLFTTIPQIAKMLNLTDDGFRLVINTGKNGGQTVPHLHIHLIGGRELTWPAG